MLKRVFVFDTILHDGEQSPSCCTSLDETADGGYDLMVLDGISGDEITNGRGFMKRGQANFGE
jgi:hypothetical protein